MAKFLDPAYVAAELEKIGTKFFSVEFAKKSGEVTVRTGRVRTYSRRVDPATASNESIRRAALATAALHRDNAVFADYPNPEQHGGKAGFRFDLDRVVAIGDIAAR